jgi:hypothetical protein
MRKHSKKISQTRRLGSDEGQAFVREPSFGPLDRTAQDCYRPDLWLLHSDAERPQSPHRAPQLDDDSGQRGHVASPAINRVAIRIRTIIVLTRCIV